MTLADTAPASSAPRSGAGLRPGSLPGAARLPPPSFVRALRPDKLGVLVGILGVVAALSPFATFRANRIVSGASQSIAEDAQHPADKGSKPALDVTH